MKLQLVITSGMLTKLRGFLDKKVEAEVSFNTVAYIWNFFPVTRMCPTRGSGYFCSQLISEALAYAGIIELEGTVTTKGVSESLSLLYTAVLPPEAQRSEEHSAAAKHHSRNTCGHCEAANDRLLRHARRECERK